MGQAWNCEWFGFVIVKVLFWSDNDNEKYFKVLGWLYNGSAPQWVKLMVRPGI